MTFLVKNAEKLDFDENSFDLIIGKGILHHINIYKVFNEIKRVLKPEGTAIFLEPMGVNVLFNFLRDLLPTFESLDEHPLIKNDINTIRNFFYESYFKFFHFFSIGAIFFSKFKIFSKIFKSLSKLDAKLFRFLPSLGLLSWSCLAFLRKPKK